MADNIEPTADDLDRPEYLPAKRAQQEALAKIDHITMQDMAIVFQESGLCKTSNPAQIIAKMQIGRELGLQPFQSINAIDIIEGRPILKPLLLAALIRRSGRYDYKISKLTIEEVEVVFYKVKGQERVVLGSLSWTMKDAIRAGLAAKDNWRKYPRNMLFHRCLADGSRFYCPDVHFSPIYTPDEMGLVTDEDGAVRSNMVEADWREVKVRMTKPERTYEQRQQYAALIPVMTEKEKSDLEAAAFSWDVTNDQFSAMLVAVEEAHAVHP